MTKTHLSELSGPTLNICTQGTVLDLHAFIFVFLIFSILYLLTILPIDR